MGMPLSLIFFSGAFRASLEVGTTMRKLNPPRATRASRIGTWISGPQAFGYSPTIRVAPSSLALAAAPFSIMRMNGSSIPGM